MPRSVPILETVDDVEAAYYDALARGDVEALMALWAEDEEIVCIHPNAPRLVGHAAVRASWEAILEHGGLHLRPTRLHAAQNLMTAMHSVVEEVGKLPPDVDAPPDAHVLATNLYLKTAQGWRLVLHHASIAPGAPGGEVPPATLLH